MSADKVGPNMKTVTELVQIIHPAEIQVCEINPSHYLSKRVERGILCIFWCIGSSPSNAIL